MFANTEAKICFVFFAIISKQKKHHPVNLAIRES